MNHFASRVFFVGVLLMFVLITIHNVSSAYKMVRAYAYYIDTPFGIPVVYFQDFVKWDNYIHPIILALMTWLGDYLAIYRCFLIWDRNIWVILLPSFFLFLSIGVTSVNLFWFKNPDSIPWAIIAPFLAAIFPINLAQNVMTTALIAFRIWRHHQEAQLSGLSMSPSTINFLFIIRIVVESASIYTIETLVMIVLFYTAHPGLIIVQHILSPSIGIVFTLIAVRIHISRHESTADCNDFPMNSLHTYGSWMRVGNTRLPRPSPPMPIVTTVTEYRNAHPEDTSPTKSVGTRSEFSSSTTRSKRSADRKREYIPPI